MEFFKKIKNSKLASKFGKKCDKQVRNGSFVSDSLTYLQHVDTPYKDRAFGSILGAFLGDSIGSYLEFKKKPCSDE